MAKTKAIVNVNGIDYNLRNSIYTSNLSPIAVSDNMSGKMLHIPSISSNTLLNPNCNRYRTIAGSICEKCYAKNTLSRYKSVRDNASDNYNLLTSGILDLDLLPKFDSRLTKIVRLESFGDIANEYHLINFVNICNLSSDVTFVLWTKNPHIVKAVFDNMPKPENLIIIQSSLFMNEVIERANEYIDKVFVVWSSEEKANENGCTINCGSRDCFGCLRCYANHNYEVIHELLK